MAQATAGGGREFDAGTRAPQRALESALLHTKLHLPAPGPYQVVRRRLFERLDLLTRRKLTLVAAPAGFGKTTLLGAWLQRGGVSAAWLSLDEADNDPARFWSYVLTALEAAWPDGAPARHGPALGTDEGTGGAKSAEGTAPHEPQAALVALLNRAVALPSRLLLILDDYHLITTAAIHEAMAFLIDRLPANLGVVIVTRADPPLPLSRLRARAELGELRVAELRFTSAEARAFLVEAVGLALTVEQAAALEERTEGWVVGLHLAALSLQERQGADLDMFIRAFTGSHRFILDYLIDEVLEQQPPEVQEFLIRSAILERLCGPLCDAIGGGTMGKRCWSRWSVAISSWCRWTRNGAGIATTICSPMSCAPVCARPRPRWWPGCTAWPASGTSARGCCPRRSATCRVPGRRTGPPI